MGTNGKASKCGTLNTGRSDKPQAHSVFSLNKNKKRNSWDLIFITVTSGQWFVTKSGCCAANGTFSNCPTGLLVWDSQSDFRSSATRSQQLQLGWGWLTDSVNGVSAVAWEEEEGGSSVWAEAAQTLHVWLIKMYTRNELLQIDKYIYSRNRYRVKRYSEKKCFTHNGQLNLHLLIHFYFILLFYFAVCVCVCVCVRVWKQSRSSELKISFSQLLAFPEQHSLSQ